MGIAADGNNSVLRTEGAELVLRDYEDFATFMRTVETVSLRA